MPRLTHAWFHHPAGCDHFLVSEDQRVKDRVSDTYIFLQNRAGCKAGLLHKGISRGGAMAGAGQININIPFGLLSKTVMNPEAMLDRRIAANLRLKNLLDQYLSMKKRNALLLEDLRIPYLEGEPKGEVSTPEIEPAQEMKRKISQLIRFQENGRARLPVMEDSGSYKALAGIKKGSSPESSFKESRLSPPGEGYGGAGVYQSAYGKSSELPWIFAMGLRLIRYVITHKFEILAWAAVMVVAGFICVLVLKR